VVPARVDSDQPEVAYCAILLTTIVKYENTNAKIYSSVRVRPRWKYTVVEMRGATRPKSGKLGPENREKVSVDKKTGFVGASPENRQLKSFPRNRKKFKKKKKTISRSIPCYWVPVSGEGG